MKIVVVGAGAFGTALSLVFLRAGHHVTLKPRRHEHAEELLRLSENRRYLPGVPLHMNLHIDATPQCLYPADLIVLATPTQQTPTIMTDLRSLVPDSASLMIVSKGILTENPLKEPFISDWLLNHFPNHSIYIMSGPNFAAEIARDLPAASTLAHRDEGAAKDMAEALWHSHFRFYPTTDCRGVEIAGAIKNVYAIACGICVGLNLGQSALAAVITRSLAEIKRLGMVMGAKPETFLGLSGVGDLTMTCSSPISRNMTLGMELAKGRGIADILAERHTIAEGVATSKALHMLKAHYGVSMRLADAIYQIVHGGQSVDAVIPELLSRHVVRFEGD